MKAPTLFATLLLLCIVGIQCASIEVVVHNSTKVPYSSSYSKSFNRQWSRSGQMEVEEADVNCESLSCDECSQMSCTDQCSCACRSRCQSLNTCSNCQIVQSSNCQGGCSNGCSQRCQVNNCGNQGCASLYRKCSQSNCQNSKSRVVEERIPVYEQIPMVSSQVVPSTPSEHANSQSGNVSTVLDIVNHINATNEIHIPVHVNHTNLNTVHVTGGSIHSAPINITVGSSNTHTGGNQSTPCCMQMGPQICKYNEDKHLNCTNSAQQKVCGPQCSSPIIYKQPVPHQIINGASHVVEKHVPVPVPQPYPVPQIQKVFVPHPVQVIKHVPHHVPVPQPYPVTKVERVMIPQPYPVTRIQQVMVPHPVPVPQPYPVTKIQQVPIVQTVQVPQPYPVTRIERVQVPVPQVQQPLVVQQPMMVQQQASACPLANWQGASYPTCATVQDSTHLVGTQQQFLLDGFIKQATMQQSLCASNPWLPCTNGMVTSNVQNCGNCVFCNGQYSPEICMNSPLCSATCRQTILASQVQKQFSRSLSCSISGTGTFQCK